MAETKPKQRTGLLRSLAQRINGNMDDLYRNTYYTDPTNRHQLASLKTDIATSIRKIKDTSSDATGEPNVSKLYERLLLKAQSNGSTITEFDRIFSDNEFVSNLTASYLDNRWVKAIDMEIDEVLRYMPKLQEAIDTMTDNVLSADSFSKDFLNLSSEVPDGAISQQQFDRNIDELKRLYKLPKLVKDIYKRISKYGECFVYRVPYEKALQRLLDKKQFTSSIFVKSNNESVVIESAQEVKSINLSGNLDSSSMTIGLNLNVTIENGFISSIIESESKSREVLSKLHEQSIFSEGMFDIESSSKSYIFDRTMDQNIQGQKLPTHHKFDQTLGDKLELPQDDNDTTADGLYDPNKKAPRIKPINGCIVKILKRERVVPIILNEVCLGYYYFEFDAGMELFDERLSSTGLMNTLTGIRSNGRSEAFDAMQRREELLRTIAAELANKIDVKFVDNNQDLKKEIYYILKYNDEFTQAAGAANNIRVSYIPPEDICHFYFELDENTGRGISDLNLSLIPAKLWVAIYITNCLAIMTRGNDKRVYYVKQSVENNIAKTLLKTINEIKKANFGIRQIENINSVLNITGRFNDYIIPRGPDGQAPIEFEVMQGQQIEIKTELLNLLEEAAINIIGVPIEIIQNRQSPDYAMQLTMSSSKFLRFVYDRQSYFQTQISGFVTDLYDIEYSTNERVTLTLPPPLFINVTNTNQLVTNTSDYCEQIVNIMMADEQDDQAKQRFARELKLYYLGSYINIANIKTLAEKAKQMKTVEQVKSGNGDDGGDNY